MRFIDELAWRGLSCRIEPETGLKVSPCWRIEQYEGLSQEIERRRDELIEEIRQSAVLIPAYNFAMVAADLTVKWSCSPEQLVNTGDRLYIPVTPECYAWLRAQMSKVKAQFDADRFDAKTYEIMRARFNVVHNWAMAHYGDAILLEATRAFDESQFMPPVASEDGHKLFNARCAKCGELTAVTVRVGDYAYPWQYHCAKCGYWVRMSNDEVGILNNEMSDWSREAIGRVPKTLAELEVLCQWEQRQLESMWEAREYAALLRQSYKYAGVAMPADVEPETEAEPNANANAEMEAF